MSLRKGILKTFNGVDYTATVQLTGSPKVYLEDITVARNIAAGEMSPGRKVTLVFSDENNAREAVVIAVYT